MEGEGYSEEYTNTQMVSLIWAEWLFRAFALVVIDDLRFDDGLTALKYRNQVFKKSWKKLIETVSLFSEIQ